MSQEGGPRSAAFTAGTSQRPNKQVDSQGFKSRDALKNKTAAGFFSVESDAIPSYTIKEGGTLKKKPQPMGADKLERGMHMKAQMKSTTAPGSYNLPSMFDNKHGRKNAYTKTAAQRLIEMGMIGSRN